MKLKYRGTTYETQPLSLNLVEKQLIGKYRGQDCYRAVYDTSMIPQSHSRLKYRGVAYGGEVEQAAPIGTVQESTFKIQVPQHQKPVYSSRHQAMSALDKVHNKFLLEKLEQRISAARQKGDENLVHMLEIEKNQLG